MSTPTDADYKEIATKIIADVLGRDAADPARADQLAEHIKRLMAKWLPAFEQKPADSL